MHGMNHSTLFSKMAMFQSRASGPSTWQASMASRMLESCERGGLLEKVLAEHDAMMCFLVRECNTANNTDGYSDDHFRREELAARIQLLFQGME